MTTAFKTAKAAKYEAAKALKTASEACLITSIEAERFETEDAKGWVSVVHVDLVPGTALTDEDNAMLAPFVVRMQEREVEVPTAPQKAVKAPGGVGKIKARAEWAKSTAEKPIDLCRRIVREMVDAPRADVIAALLAAGVNKATASTQYARIRKAMREETPVDNVIQMIAAE